MATTVKPRVVAAALLDMITGHVYSLPAPARHHHVIRIMIDEGCRPPITMKRYQQGFLVSDGRFLGRETAEKVARDAGQLTKPLIGAVLTSEDLW